MLEKCIKATLASNKPVWIVASHVCAVREALSAETAQAGGGHFTVVYLDSGDHVVVREDPIAILTAVPV